MTLVRIRCKKCRRLLLEVERRPASWDGQCVVPACQRCVGWPDRGLPDLSEGTEFRRTTAIGVPWARLRSSIEKSERVGAPVEFLLPA
jgi:hypothetical protein